MKVQERTGKAYIYALRSLLLLAIAGGAYYRQDLQRWVDRLWAYLLTSWLFNCVYFETWWTVICYAVTMVVSYVMSHIRYLDKYKIDSRLKWQSAGLRVYVVDVIIYCSPLMLLDTFMVKKYHGVDPMEWAARRQSWVQKTRALPIEPPGVALVVVQLVCSFIIYDAMFCALHFALHKNRWLYKYVHADHHDHHLVHSRVTNQLTVVERIALVLSANQALKFMHSHPLTRAIFVPLFVSWLTENHCGYDLPWTMDKVVPFGLIAGAPRHNEHHVHGSRYYQPFFTYIDNFLLNSKDKQS